MSAWTVAVVILVVAILIPTLVVATENFRTHRRAAPRRRATAPQGGGMLERLEGRLTALEDDVDELRRAVHDLSDEADELRRDPPGRSRPER